MTNNNIIGYLQKSYNKDSFKFTSAKGNQYFIFTIKSKNPDDTLSWYNCISYTKDIDTTLEELENKLIIVDSENYVITEKQYQGTDPSKFGVVYKNYTVKDIKLLPKKAQSESTQSVTITATNSNDTLPVISSDDPIFNMPF
jgi:hypothetical protein